MTAKNTDENVLCENVCTHMKWWDLKPLLIVNYSKAPFRDEKTNLRKQNNFLIVLQS